MNSTDRAERNARLLCEAYTKRARRGLVMFGASLVLSVWVFGDWLARRMGMEMGEVYASPAAAEWLHTLWQIGVPVAVIGLVGGLFLYWSYRRKARKAMPATTT